MTKEQALDLAATVGGSAHPLNPFNHGDDWYVLGETDAATRERARWDLNRDGVGVIVGSGAPTLAQG